MELDGWGRRGAGVRCSLLGSIASFGFGVLFCEGFMQLYDMNNPFAGGFLLLNSLLSFSVRIGSWWG